MELTKVEPSAIDSIALTLRLRGTNWWNDENYHLPPIKDGDSSVAEDLLQGLYNQARISGDELDKIIQYIDDARRATTPEPAPSDSAR